ncbi:hypothetical protein ES702_02754 [subsurface metagenome]
MKEITKAILHAVVILLIILVVGILIFESMAPSMALQGVTKKDILEIDYKYCHMLGMEYKLKLMSQGGFFGDIIEKSYCGDYLGNERDIDREHEMYCHLTLKEMFGMCE